MRTADLLSSDGPTALQTVTQYLHTTAIKQLSYFNISKNNVLSQGDYDTPRHPHLYTSEYTEECEETKGKCKEQTAQKHKGFLPPTQGIDKRAGLQYTIQAPAQLAASADASTYTHTATDPLT